MFNKALTISKLCTLFFIITMALFNFKTENLNPFTLEEKGGFKATIKAAGLVFFSYLGFDMITTLSDEAKNPVKDVPLAVKDNTIIVTIIYFVTAFSICGMARL
jgi:APA family basic amino acid/polyamine antiporter